MARTTQASRRFDPNGLEGNGGKGRFRQGGGVTLLDNFLPAYDCRERHHAFVTAPAARGGRALRQLSPADLPLMRMLMSIRSIPSQLSGRGGWAPDSRRTVLEEFGEAGFLTLAEDDREIVVGRIA